MAMVLHRMVGSIHHGSAQISPACLGDPTACMALATIVDLGPQSSISHQLFCGREASNVTNGRQDRDGRQHCYSWKLDQQWDALIPDTLSLQTFFNLLDLLLSEL